MKGKITLLVLDSIVKDYVTGDTAVRALDNVSLAFRKNEFVSILGHSGCGKTTMLNIIGGLDKYTSGIMSIKGVGTENYTESDWDAYRNHSIGFVFQSYNLIPHQTVLANVELALTLSGVSKAERRKRAEEALISVGLGSQLHKKPSQMSGGQMQRVAIARALVNNPEILLADEPTGALDTDTSVQIMDILKEISKDKLIIMVTHNPELAEKYSDRIIRLSDGKVVGDTNPFSFEDEKKEIFELEKTQSSTETSTDGKAKKSKNKKRKPSMSFTTALSLSFNNLLTKKTRTFLTSFAGSIGIIGIALILSLSNGINAFISRVQKETLSSYPITLQREEVDMTSMISALMAKSEPIDNPDPNKVYVNAVTYGMLNSMLNPETTQNNLKKFKEYIDSGKSDMDKYAQVIKYGYNVTLNPYLLDKDNKYYKADVNELFSDIMGRIGMSYGSYSSSMMSYGSSIWQEMLPPDSSSSELMHSMVKEQYELVAGSWPKDKSEVLLLVNSDNAITDLSLYCLGLYTADEIFEIVVNAANGIETDTNISYDFDKLIYTGENDTEYIKYKIIPNTSYYYYKDTDNDKVADKWVDLRTDGTESELNGVISDGLEVKITGIIRQNPEATAGSLSGTIIYTSALTEYIIDSIAQSPIVTAQNQNSAVDVFTGLPFVQTDVVEDQNKPLAFKSYLSTASNAKKAEIYTSILKTPKDSDVKAIAETYLMGIGIEEHKNDREWMFNFALNYVSEEQKELVQLYLGKMNAEQLYAYLYEIALETARESIASEGQLKIDAILNTPNNIELDAEKSKILIKALYLNDPSSVEAIYNMVYPQSIKDGSETDGEENRLTNEQMLSLLLEYMNTYSASLDTYGGYAAGILTVYGTPEFEKAYLLNRYSTVTSLDRTQMEAMLNALEPSELDSLFYTEYEKEATDNYKDTMSSSQSEVRKNEKLAKALDEAVFTDEELVGFYDSYVPVKAPTTLEENFELLGVADKSNPDQILIYANSFEEKELIEDIIADYNNKQTNEDDKITYTDYVGLIMSSVTSIINAITYVLVFFVSISLVVSSIMIGIITYISVLERTKEIGILRAIGASKRDVSRVFNAETLIVGFTAGMIGIIVTVLLNIPIALIIKHFSGISGLASLPILAAVILVLISMALTLISGLIPSGIAAKKDPVESLRSE